jgi:MFS transporter, PCFT/HCP family, solute carrier family 46 (folate transporter), member 1
MEVEKSEEVRENILEKNVARRYVRWSYGLEPAYFALFFAFNLTNAVLQNQLLKQTCLMMDFNITVCTNLNTDNETKIIEEMVQPKVANINMSILLLNSIVPALLSLVLGSWSDIYGRKKILMMSYTGYTTTLGLITLFSYISDNIQTLTPWVYLVAELPMT